MSYVDGFVLVVPKRKIAVYKKMATRAAKVWRITARSTIANAWATTSR